MPSAPGDVTIGPFSLVYFDVDQGGYHTISTDPIRLKVRPGEPATLVQAGPDPVQGKDAGPLPGEKQAVVLKNRDILDIREDISGIRPDSQLPLSWFLVLVLAPGLGFAGFSTLIQYRRREKSIGQQLRDEARAHLARAEKAAPGSAECLGHLQSALSSALLAKGKERGPA